MPLASLTACSGEAEPPPEQPRLPAAVAEDLAERSDLVAELLAAGDRCDAAHAADDLQTETIAAINRGDVPAPFQEELAAAASALVDEVNCPPPTEEQEDEEGDGDGKEDGNGKDNGKDNGKGKGKGEKKE